MKQTFETWIILFRLPRCIHLQIKCVLITKYICRNKRKVNNLEDAKHNQPEWSLFFRKWQCLVVSIGMIDLLFMFFLLRFTKDTLSSWAFDRSGFVATDRFSSGHMVGFPCYDSSKFLPCLIPFRLLSPHRLCCTAHNFVVYFVVLLKIVQDSFIFILLRFDMVIYLN
jgi:hypothetical protein